MSTKIFVNLPVKDLNKAMTFYKGMGYTFNPQFTDETAACMVISEDIYAMLLTHAKFRDFTPKAIADSTKTSEVLIALSCDSRAEVEKVVASAVKSGGNELKTQDLGFMYSKSYEDLDGHIWEVFWMDPAAIKS